MRASVFVFASSFFPLVSPFGVLLHTSCMLIGCPWPLGCIFFLFKIFCFLPIKKEKKKKKDSQEF